MHGNVGGIHIAVRRIVVGIALVPVFEGRRTGVEAAAPDENLVLAVLRSSLGLVETLQRSVVTLVETPGLDDGQPCPIHLVEHDVERVNRALEVARVAQVEIVALGSEHAPALSRLGTSSLGQIHISPTREQVLLIPFALAVADEHEGHSLVVCHRNRLSSKFNILRIIRISHMIHRLALRGATYSATVRIHL